LLIWCQHLDSFTVSTMTCVTVTEYLCHKCPRICSVCRNYNFLFSPCMTQDVCHKRRRKELLTLCSGVCVFHFVQLHFFRCLAPMSATTMFGSFLLTFCFVGSVGFIYIICTGVQQDFYIRWYSCRLTVTRRVSLVEQELWTLPNHTRSLPFLMGSMLFNVLISVLYFVHHCLALCPFCFVFAIALSVLQIMNSDLSFFELRILFCPSSNYGFCFVLLRITDSIYPFSISKPFWQFYCRNKTF
jgi:hypothetical protein